MTVQDAYREVASGPSDGRAVYIRDSIALGPGARRVRWVVLALR
jgi:hypothetical protein